MINALRTQLKNAEEIKGVLKEVSITFKIDGNQEVKTLLVCLPIKNGQSNHSDFFRIIKEGLLINFVFSCSKIEKKLGVKNPNSAEELFNNAIRKLSQHTAKGELGELMLFTLLDVYFKAPKILSKITLKTARRVPVFGADAVHGQFEKDGFKLYLGESKLHKACKSAATKAAESMKNAKDKYEDEFDLLDDHIDFLNMDEALQEELMNLLNPFSNKEVSDLIHSPCFIGFTEAELISNAESDDDFIESYKKLAGEYIADFFAKTENQGLTLEEVSLLMLPFSCIDNLVKEFIEYMGIQE